MSNREFTQKIEERYLGQSIHEFLSAGGDIREYARQVFAREVFGADVDPRDEELGITTESDLAQALEYAARVEVTTTAQALADQGVDFAGHHNLADGDRQVTVTLDGNVARYYWHDEDGDRFQEPFNREALTDQDAAWLREILA